MRPEFEQRVAKVASDRASGASEILDEVIAILRDAIAAGEDLPRLAAGLREAQPSMAAVWNATRAALATADGPESLERFARRAARAPEAMVRFAAGVLGLGLPPGGGLRLVTLSYSRSVLRVLEALARERPVHVACAEGRPAYEGRRMADRIAAAGMTVAFFTDAAIACALTDAHAVVVGADAVTPEWFLNKTGTRMLAAAAGQQGVEIHVAATRDKFVDSAAGEELAVRSGAPDEVWAHPPDGVEVRNPYFERVPLADISTVICDAGALSPDDLRNMSF